MSDRRAVIVGAFEHPRRRAEDVTTFQLLDDVVSGALEDAGIPRSEVDGFFCDSTLGGNPMVPAEYLGLTSLRHFDSTDAGGASYLVHVAHAARALESGDCDVALIAMAGRGRSELPYRPAAAHRMPFYPFEELLGPTQPALYALAAYRHMVEFGTTAEQLAQVRVVASQHAQHNPNALYAEPVTVEEVLESPMIADPLRRLDCCVTTDGGGALVLTRQDIARSLSRQAPVVLGVGYAMVTGARNPLDALQTAAAYSGPAAFEAARVTPGDIDYASIYDSFTITVVMTLEDLGFCPKGEGGRFVEDGNLSAPDGGLPINTDGGGLCNNHPGRRGGMPRTIEAVRQLRGEAAPAVQVPSCELALVHGTGGALPTRHTGATLILGAGI